MVVVVVVELCGNSWLCIMARRDVSILAQETTAAIVLFSGKLHALACLSLAWKGTVCRVKKIVADSFLASDLDLSFIPTQRSVDNSWTTCARTVAHSMVFPGGRALRGRFRQNLLGDAADAVCVLQSLWKAWWTSHSARKISHKISHQRPHYETRYGMWVLGKNNGRSLA